MIFDPKSHTNPSYQPEMGVGILYLRLSRLTEWNLTPATIVNTVLHGFSVGKGLNLGKNSSVAGFVKYLLFARMDCTVPRFTVSCSRCAVSCDLLRFDSLSSDSVKCKGVSYEQGIEYAAQNRQKRKKPCAAFNTQHRAFLCCRFLIVLAPLFFLSCFMQGCHS